MTDGPAGVRMKRRTTTAMPAPITLSCAFDDELAQRFGRYLALEARAKRQDVLIGPMLNLLRQPYGGRNFELFGEDPLLVARTGVAVVTGIQSGDVIAMGKHYLANNQEHERMTIDVRVAERTLHEMELPAFVATVRAGMGALMGATNSVNGAFSCQNEDLLEVLLRQQLGFTGWVMSDWDAVQHRRHHRRARSGDARREASGGATATGRPRGAHPRGRRRPRRRPGPERYGESRTAQAAHARLPSATPSAVGTSPTRWPCAERSSCTTAGSCPWPRPRRAPAPWL